MSGDGVSLGAVLDQITISPTDITSFAKARVCFTAYGNTLVFGRAKRYKVLEVLMRSGFQEMSAEGVVMQLEGAMATQATGWKEFAPQPAPAPPAAAPAPPPAPAAANPDGVNATDAKRGGSRDRTATIHVAAQRATWTSVDAPLPTAVQQAAPRLGDVMSIRNCRKACPAILAHLLTHCGRHVNDAQFASWAAAVAVVWPKIEQHHLQAKDGTVTVSPFCLQTMLTSKVLNYVSRLDSVTKLPKGDLSVLLPNADADHPWLAELHATKKFGASGISVAATIAADKEYTNRRPAPKMPSETSKPEKPPEKPSETSKESGAEEQEEDEIESGSPGEKQSDFAGFGNGGETTFDGSVGTRDRGPMLYERNTAAHQGRAHTASSRHRRGAVHLGARAAAKTCPKPKSAAAIFKHRHRRAVKQKLGSSAAPSDVTAELTSQWKALSQGEMAKYMALAADEKKRYLQWFRQVPALHTPHFSRTHTHTHSLPRRLQPPTTRTRCAAGNRAWKRHAAAPP